MLPLAIERWVRISLLPGWRWQHLNRVPTFTDSLGGSGSWIRAGDSVEAGDDVRVSRDVDVDSAVNAASDLNLIILFWGSE